MFSGLVQISSSGLEALAESPILKKLRWLDLSFNHLSDGGLERIIAGCDTEKLERLHLSINRLTSGALETILRADGPLLEHLDLFGNAITGEGPGRPPVKAVITAMEKEA